MNWREAALFVAILIVMTILVTRQSKGQEEAPPQRIVACVNGTCTLPQDELRMLVQRAKLCGWEAK